MTSRKFYQISYFVNSAKAASKSTSHNIEALSTGEWGAFVAAFTAAFDSGDVDTLQRFTTEEFKRDRAFWNINDLGGKFMKYGPGMGNWTMLIEDAKKNKK